MRIFLSLLLLLLNAPGAFAEGNCTGSCGGDLYRQPLEDLAVDTFQSLVAAAESGPLRIGQGKMAKMISKEEIENLQDALLDSIQKNEIKVTYSENDWNCPLKDNGGTCVTFLTDTESKQLSVDMGRIMRAHADTNFLQRTLIHEAYRLSLAEDVNDQYSRQLAQIARKKSEIDPEVVRALRNLVNSYIEQFRPPAELSLLDCDQLKEQLKKELAPLENNIGAIGVVVDKASKRAASAKAYDDIRRKREAVLKKREDADSKAVGHVFFPDKY